MAEEEFTVLEKEKLAIFRSRVEKILTHDDQKDDEFLIRWLIARDMDVDKAEEMLIKSLEWRQVRNLITKIYNKNKIP